MKKDDIPALAAKLSGMLPMLQMDIWKELKMSRRECSRLMIELEKEGLIKRTKQKTKIGFSYLIEKLNGKAPVVEKKKDYASLLSDTGRFSPCCGCVFDCVPKLCQKLDVWIRE